MCVKVTPPVKHSKGFRERKRGFHSNDIKSEFSALKGWSRNHYGRLRLAEFDLFEYTYYSIGGSMDDVMCGLVYASGGQYTIVPL